jgi:hypothetical protein
MHAYLVPTLPQISGFKGALSLRECGLLETAFNAFVESEASGGGTAPMLHALLPPLEHLADPTAAARVSAHMKSS